MGKKYGYAIVNSGEKAIVYNLEGQARIIEGPRRIFLWREKFKLLCRFTASQTEYLIVKHRDGKLEHIKGPCSMFRIPTIHDSIYVKSAITLDAQELIVVYRHNGDASEKTVERYLEYGPKMFVPASNEWLHTFCWHGIDPDNKTRQIPASNIFTKLKLIPDQFYYNVDEIRTSDNGLVRIKLMIFHEIQDVNTMLGATDDPIGDIISCITADVTIFTAARTYVNFVETSSKLNDLSNYPHLTKMCKMSGIRVTKVVFRGYFAAPKIQASHDEVIDKRTYIQLAFEKEQQSQEMLDRELTSEKERLTSQHELQQAEVQQTHKIAKMKQKHSLELQMKTTTDIIDRDREKAEAEITQRKCEMDQTIAHYAELAKLGVDLTTYIVNEAAIPERVTKIVTAYDQGVAGTGARSSNTNVHLHLGVGGADDTI